MPYLGNDRKREIDDDSKMSLVSAGHLTYVFTRISLTADLDCFSDEIMTAIDRYMPRQPRYENYAIVLGCLDSTRRELRRRQNGVETKTKNRIDNAWYMLTAFSDSYYRNVVAPYEDEKIDQNGDVF